MDVKYANGNFYYLEISTCDGKILNFLVKFKIKMIF